MQGLHDPHVHLIQGGLSLAQLDLAAITSKRELVAAVAQACGALLFSWQAGFCSLIAPPAPASWSALFPASCSSRHQAATQCRDDARTSRRRHHKARRWQRPVAHLAMPCAERAPPGSWVKGFGWSEDLWESLPHRSWLDPVCPGKPVMLMRRDNHMAVINSRAGALCPTLASQLSTGHFCNPPPCNSRAVPWPFCARLHPGSHRTRPAGGACAQNPAAVLFGHSHGHLPLKEGESQNCMQGRWLVFRKLQIQPVATF